MRVTGFIWLEEIVEKLAVKHHVVPEEIEEVFTSGSRLRTRRMNRGHYRNEDVYRTLGQTADGRYLAVFFVHKLSGEALVLSARDIDEKERRSHARP
jgi:hypothetical protein